MQGDGDFGVGVGGGVLELGFDLGFAGVALFEVGFELGDLLFQLARLLSQNGMRAGFTSA